MSAKLSVPYAMKEAQAFRDLAGFSHSWKPQQSEGTHNSSLASPADLMSQDKAE
jgi:hypothetical protein